METRIFRCYFLICPRVPYIVPLVNITFHCVENEHCKNDGVAYQNQHIEHRVLTDRRNCNGQSVLIGLRKATDF